MTTGGLCPSGFYCPEGSGSPLPCDGGTYCEHPGLSLPTDNCTEGYYCNHTSSEPNQHTCPMGHYCPVGTAVPIGCPVGTYSNTTHNNEISDCVNCTGGMYCQGDGNVEPSGFCDPGYYCPGGQDTPSPMDLLCWRGRYCPLGTTTPELCANGTYQYDEGRAECDVCPAGYYCDPIHTGTSTDTPYTGIYCMCKRPIYNGFWGV